ncbi:MAG: hypothetical protein E2P01_05740 [Acidobacteria bacterium]|nr:MAG: hypothetical protein E2P01_05740 [Acidobacteriota bacterium]
MSVDPTLKNSIALYVFLVLGLFLAVAPWTPVWYEVTVLLLPTRFGAPLQQGWVRGLVSAVGVLDLLAAGSAGLDLVRSGSKRDDV